MLISRRISLAIASRRHFSTPSATPLAADAGLAARRSASPYIFNLRALSRQRHPPMAIITAIATYCWTVPRFLRHASKMSGPRRARRRENFVSFTPRSDCRDAAKPATHA